MAPRRLNRNEILRLETIDISDGVVTKRYCDDGRIRYCDEDNSAILERLLNDEWVIVDQYNPARGAIGVGRDGLFIDAEPGTTMIGGKLEFGVDPMAGLMGAMAQPPTEPRNVVLFGAGVSRFAGDVLPSPPPLAVHLLGELRSFDPATWGSLPERYLAQFSENFEFGMAAVFENEVALLSDLMKSLSIYFTQFYLDVNGSSAYVRFMENLKRRGTASKTIFSTLNYECLLPESAALSGFQRGGCMTIIREGWVSIWHLHGSCTHLPALVQLLGIKYDGATIFEGGFKSVNPPEAQAFLKSHTTLYSAMCMFAPGKPVQFHPRFFKAMHESWGARAKCAHTVLVAGSRPNETDIHIWGPLSETEAHVGFIGDKVEYDKWIPSREGRRSSYLGSEFQNLVAEAADFVSAYPATVDEPEVEAGL